LDDFKIRTGSPLDMNWDAEMDVRGVKPAPVFEFQSDFLPFRVIQNLEIKYEWLKRVF
jgi:hypothetical protein